MKRETAALKRDAAAPAADPRPVAGTPLKVGQRARNKADKLFRITAAARKLFNERGFEATTVQAVADLAEIGAGTLFSYAKSKEDLLIIVFMDDLFEVALRGSRSARRKTHLLDRVVTLYASLLNFHFRDLELSRHLARETAVVRNPERSVETKRLIAMLDGSVASFIYDDIAQGTFDPAADVARIANHCFRLYFTALLHALTSGTSPAAAADELRISLDYQLRPFKQRT